jgi:thioredoxin-like negative regulator of GroEL
MKEAVIAFLLALVIGSFLNGWQAAQQSDTHGSTSGAQSSSGGNSGAVIDPDNEPPRPNSTRHPDPIQPQSMSIPKLDEPGFDRDVIKSASPVLVFFSAQGSTDCAKMLPIVQQVAQLVQSDVRVVQVDVWSNPILGEEYGASKVPMFAVFKDGKEIDSAQGELDTTGLLSFVKKTVPNAGNG